MKSVLTYLSMLLCLSTYVHAQSCEDLAFEIHRPAYAYLQQRFPTLYMHGLERVSLECTYFAEDFRQQIGVSQYAIDFAQKRATEIAQALESSRPDTTCWSLLPDEAYGGFKPLFHEGKYTLATGSWKMLSPFEYDWAQDYGYGFALAECNQQRFLVDFDGNRYRTSFWANEINDSIQALVIPTWDSILHPNWIQPKSLCSILPAAEKLPALEVLICNGEVDSTIFGFPTLRRLSLNNMEAFPSGECIGNLQQLESLEIFNCKHLNLPSSIGRCARLQRLELEACGNDSLPPTLENVPKLKSLYIAAPSWRSLPTGLFEMDSLEELLLFHTGVEGLPSEIGNLHHLRILDIVESNLVSLPAESYQLQELEYLRISSSGLTSISQQLGELHALRSLTLYNGKLNGRFPDVFEQLPNLEWLDLGSNDIVALPASLGRLSNLKVLVLDRMLLSKLPKEIRHLSKLERLDIRDNPCADSPQKQAKIQRQMARWLPICRVYFD